jgi:hypothetical protein
MKALDFLLALGFFTLVVEVGQPWAGRPLFALIVLFYLVLCVAFWSAYGRIFRWVQSRGPRCPAGDHRVVFLTDADGAVRCRGCQSEAEKTP